ncbi:MAG: glycosyltransferase family 4 protein [Caldilineaceae bacterium]|nr:glycosyltransferase family 4 protein [Caldilineaceae bacterium]
MVAPTSFFADYGCHVRILEETRILQKLGHQVTIATYHNGKNVEGIDIRRTLPIPWRRHYEVGSSRHKLVFDALLGLKTLELLARGHYDIIHAHLHEGALIAHLLGKLFGLPVVFDFQGSLTEEMIDHHFLERESFFYQPLRRLERWINRTSSIIFTSSAHAERHLLEQFGCDPAQVRVLPDCVNADVFLPSVDLDPTAQADLRRQLNIPDGHKVIVYLGLLAEYQGTGLLLEALQRILATHPDVYLLLMGFPGVQQYRQQAKALGIDHAITFTGRMSYEDAPRYLALGDVAVAPKLSLTEGLGKLLNYMAVALPTVAFDTPVAREYLGADGHLAVRGDVESLADKILASLYPAATDKWNQEMGKRLRQRVIQLFAWDQAGQMIVNTYRELIERRTGRSNTGPSSHTRLATQRNDQNLGAEINPGSPAL